MHFWRSGGRLGRLLGALGEILGHLGALCGPSWRPRSDQKSISKGKRGGASFQTEKVTLQEALEQDFSRIPRYCACSCAGSGASKIKIRAANGEGSAAEARSLGGVKLG